MIIGVPKEIKNNEYRVALTPAGVFELTKNIRQAELISPEISTQLTIRQK